jgi:hypothetical protein
VKRRREMKMKMNEKESERSVGVRSGCVYITVSSGEVAGSVEIL